MEAAARRGVKEQGVILQVVRSGIRRFARLIGVAPHRRQIDPEESIIVDRVMEDGVAVAAVGRNTIETIVRDGVRIRDPIAADVIIECIVGDLDSGGGVVCDHITLKLIVVAAYAV